MSNNRICCYYTLFSNSSRFTPVLLSLKCPHNNMMAPLDLAKKTIEEFKALYFKKYGKKLTDDKGNELGV